MNATEIKLNIAGAHFWLPIIRNGSVGFASVAGGRAEVQYAGLHKSWTVTRVFAAFATMGASLILGRKQKGAATLVVYYGAGNGASRAVRTRRLRTQELAAAQNYAAMFTAYADSLPVATQPSSICGLCHGLLDYGAPPYSPESIAVDHLVGGVTQLVHAGCLPTKV